MLLSFGAMALFAATPFMALIAVVAAVAGPLLSPGLAPSVPLGPGSLEPGSGPRPPDEGRIPPPMLRLYTEAASICPGLSWAVLAGIGTVESDNGQSTLPGVSSGHNFAGAEGPMQFEPATFARYSRPVPPGGADPPSPYDPTDAVYASARMLCANGAGADGTRVASAARLRGAILTYNHSTAYANQVLQLARVLVAEPSPAPGAVQAGEMAVAFALAQIGTPYRWGGETPGVAFDCSGLAQAAWAAAGFDIPRVAQQQFDAGTIWSPAEPLEPGDLVFFAGPDSEVSHVGLYIGGPPGPAMMVDAPHSGAAVRLETFQATVGAAWGGEVFIGATDPSRGRMGAGP